MIKLNGKTVKFDTFPNGETKLIEQSIYVKGTYSRKTIIFKYVNDSDLLKLMFLKRYIDSISMGYLELIVYYMPYSRQDRTENNSPFTLKYATNFINNLNFDKVVVIEPHSDVTPALLNNVEAKYINFDLLPRVMGSVDFDEGNDYIVFPDSGASKRYSKMGDFNTLVGHKKRDFDTGKITNLDIIGVNNHIGQKALIVDDLSSYGSTFVRTAKELKKMGIKEIYLLVAHAENSIFKGELFENINKVFTTDSILTECNNWENKKFEPQLKVYELEDLI